MVKQDGSIRRWYKFHQRTWLILAIVLPLVVTYGAVAAIRASTQRAVVAEIVRMGGMVYYDTNVSELSGTLYFVKELFGIDAIANVETVNLWGPAFTNTEIERLKPFTRLRTVSLDSANITDSGLEHMKRFRSLEELDLRNTNIGDKGLRELQELASLQKLNLSNTKVTDTGLTHLAGLTRLRELWLDGTQVTDAGVADLQRSLPKCKIKR